ncbi:MAG TPA: hypothetical protein VK150_08335 [Geothrix sp.]|nr:hypothetical protein [Geothrix sp.]
MSNALSFRKESIQRSSSASAPANRLQGADAGVQGMRAPHDPKIPAITTILTLTIPTL